MILWYFKILCMGYNLYYFWPTNSLGNKTIKRNLQFPTTQVLNIFLFSFIYLFIFYLFVVSGFLYWLFANWKTKQTRLEFDSMELRSEEELTEWLNDVLMSLQCVSLVVDFVIFQTFIAFNYKAINWYFMALCVRELSLYVNGDQLSRNCFMFWPINRNISIVSEPFPDFFPIPVMI